MEEVVAIAIVSVIASVQKQIPVADDELRRYLEGKSVVAVPQVPPGSPTTLASIDVRREYTPPNTQASST